jgi:hypothetical protein
VKALTGLNRKRVGCFKTLEKKGDRTTPYRKPEIVTLDETVGAIQGTVVKGSPPAESRPNSPIETVPAYEADE